MLGQEFAVFLKPYSAVYIEMTPSQMIVDTYLSTRWQNMGVLLNPPKRCIGPYQPLLAPPKRTGAVPTHRFLIAQCSPATPS